MVLLQDKEECHFSPTKVNTISGARTELFRDLQQATQMSEFFVHSVYLIKSTLTINYSLERHDLYVNWSGKIIFLEKEISHREGKKFKMYPEPEMCF